jgi:hypothetical protein
VVAAYQRMPAIWTPTAPQSLAVLTAAGCDTVVLASTFASSYWVPRLRDISIMIGDLDCLRFAYILQCRY